MKKQKSYCCHLLTFIGIIINNNNNMNGNQPEQQVVARRVNCPGSLGVIIKKIHSFIIDKCLKKDGVMVPAHDTISQAAIYSNIPKQTISRQSCCHGAPCKSNKFRDAQKAPTIVETGDDKATCK
jgi:hypothetical protein